MSKKLDAKRRALQESDTLNPHPEKVTDTLFQEYDFFDSRDLLQVKYEMLHRVRLEGWSVKQAAKTFGFSRPAFYHAQTAFEREGVAGLLPHKRGPRGAHKLSEEVMEFVEQLCEGEPTVTGSVVAKRVNERFGVKVHPRSIERARDRRKKKHLSLS
jgi:transposase